MQENHFGEEVAAGYDQCSGAELDLMANLAGLSLQDRWAGWDRAPFTGDSTSHVSVWTKPNH